MEIPQWKHTVPNYMSLARMVVGIPLIAWTFLRDNYGSAIALTFVVCISDWLDGWVARKFDQKSDIGAMLDPTADKVVVFSLLVLLLRSGKMPQLLVITMCGLVAVQVCIVVANIVAESRDMVPRVLFVGKVTMWLVMISFGADMLYAWQDEQLWYNLALLFSTTGLLTSVVALAQYAMTYSTKQCKA